MKPINAYERHLQAILGTGDQLQMYDDPHPPWEHVPLGEMVGWLLGSQGYDNDLWSSLFHLSRDLKRWRDAHDDFHDEPLNGEWGMDLDGICKKIEIIAYLHRQVLGRMSQEERGQLRTSSNLGDSDPDTVTGKVGKSLAPGQVDYITQIFHEATDAGCQLLVTLGSEEDEQALKEGTIESLAQRVVHALWRVRWELGIDSPQVEGTESEASE